jgi:hypothetical protein
METGKAIYKLLKDSADVGAICADRIYPELAQQDVDTPFIVYTVTDTTPSGTKNATSKLDTARVELYCVSDDYETGMNLGIAVRAALDRVSGTVSGVEVQSIDFDTSDIQFDPDQRVYVLEQTYDVRIQRTGTAVSYSLTPSNVITVTEQDGTPTGLVNKLVFSNGTVTINGNIATVEAGGSLTIEEADGTPSGTATTLVFPNGTVSLAGDTATLDLSLDTLDTSGILEQLAEQLADISGVTGSDFPNGLIGDFDQDGVVGSADLIVFLMYFGQSLSTDSTERAARLTAAFANGTDSPFDGVRSINSETADREGDVNLSTGQIPEGSNLYYTDARVDLRIGQALISDLSDIPDGIGTAGQVLVVNSDRTAYEFATRLQASDLAGYVQQVNGLDPDGSGNVDITTEDINEAAPNLYYTDARFDTRYATKTHYHDRYSTEAEAERSGATATLEVYYTARPDGDGYAESEVSDVGETDTINRTLYYSDKFEADPDTAGDWTQYTTQPADNATFATAKAALLAGLNDTDATAETRGTLPLSLKMVRTVTAAAGDLLLDTYTGAAAAYSVRKLDKDYTGSCMRVREDSGDTETDIGFDGSGNLDTAAIATHCGSASGFVVTWYDQSGNSNDATQSTSGYQPQIYNGTAVITNPDNSLPVLDCTVATGAGFNSATISITGTMTYSMVSFLDAPGGNYTSNATFRVTVNGTNGSVQLVGGGNTTITDSNLANDGSIHHMVRTTSSAGTLVLNTANVQSSSNTASGTSSWSFNYLGNRRTSDNVGHELQEFIVWPADQLTTNQSGIETDIDTYFSIT